MLRSDAAVTGAAVQEDLARDPSWVSVRPTRSVDAAAQSRLEQAFNQGLVQRRMDWRAMIDALDAGADADSTLHGHGLVARQLAVFPEPTLVAWWLLLNTDPPPSMMVQALVRHGVRGHVALLRPLLERPGQPTPKPWPLLQAWVEQGVLDHRPPPSDWSLGRRLFMQAEHPEALALWQTVSKRPGGSAWLLAHGPLHWLAQRRMGRAVAEGWVQAYAALDPTWTAHTTDGLAPVIHFHASAGRRGPAMVHALLAAGAPIDGRDAQERTLLHALMGRVDSPQPLSSSVWRQLEPLGIHHHVHAIDAYGNTPLHSWASTPAYPLDHLDRLLAMGADVSATTHQGRTAVHVWAHLASQGRVDPPRLLAVVQRLNAAGVDWRTVDPMTGQSALDALRACDDVTSTKATVGWLEAHLMAQDLAHALADALPTGTAAGPRVRL